MMATLCHKNTDLEIQRVFEALFFCEVDADFIVLRVTRCLTPLLFFVCSVMLFPLFQLAGDFPPESLSFSLQTLTRDSSLDERWPAGRNTYPLFAFPAVQMVNNSSHRVVYRCDSRSWRMRQLCALP
jgi:hypothetical protein